MERAALFTVVVLAGILYFHRLSDVPVHVSTDEAKFAVQAHSLATTGPDMRGNLLPVFVLIVDPLLPAERSVAWWQPVLFYAMAGVYLVADVSAGSTRIPVRALAVLNGWLVWERSQYLEAEAASRRDIASGSVLILSAGNPRLSRLDDDGWSVATIVRDATGEPAAAILRKR